MTNREWLMEQMQNMSDEEFMDSLRFKVVENFLYNSICEGCTKQSCEECEHKTAWLKAEHKEVIKLSEAERVILENVNKNYEWIARDDGGNMHVFKYKPTKSKKYWNATSSYSLCAFNHLFKFIKWEDENPYEIAELLKGEK